MSKKGVSKEEKKIRTLSYLLETKGVYQLKELEKSLYKEKGVLSQAVKDILKELVGDDEVETDKIGSSVYFWAFPSKKQQNLKRKAEEQDTKLKKLKQNVEEKEVALKSVDNKEVEGRLFLKASLDRLRNERDIKKAHFERTKYNNPAYMEELKREVKQFKKDLNRWAENIYILRTYCRDKLGVDETAFNQRFELDDDLDVPEE